MEDAVDKGILFPIDSNKRFKDILSCHKSQSGEEGYKAVKVYVLVEVDITSNHFILLLGC